MKRAALVLCLTLAIMGVAIYLLSPGTGESEAEVPQGIPPSVLNHEIDPIEKAPPKEKEPQVSSAPITPPAVENEEEPSSLPNFAWNNVDYELHVLLDGEPVTGGYAIAYRQDPGSPGEGFSTLAMLAREEKLQRPIVTENGVLKSTFSYSDGVPTRDGRDFGDSICEAVAFHPEHGTAFVEFPCDEMDAEPIELRLERGKTLRGKVVGSDGKSLDGASVEIVGCGGQRGNPRVCGLFAFTDKDGKFSISGIRFQGVPSGVKGYYSAEQVDMRGGSAIDFQAFKRDPDGLDMGTITLKLVGR